MTLFATENISYFIRVDECQETERERDRNNKCCFLSNVIQLSVRDKFRSASFFDFYNFYNFKLHSFTDVLQLRQKSSFFRLKNLNYFFAVTFESSRREMREEEKWRNGDFPEWRRRFENLPKYVFFKYLLRDLANFLNGLFSI